MESICIKPPYLHYLHCCRCCRGKNKTHCFYYCQSLLRLPLFVLQQFFVVNIITDFVSRSLCSLNYCCRQYCCVAVSCFATVSNIAVAMFIFIQFFIVLPVGNKKLLLFIRWLINSWRNQLINWLPIIT